MKNTIITTKYVLAIQAAVLAIVFLIAIPVFADDVPVSGGFNDPISGGFNDPISGGFNNPISGGFNNPVSGGFNDPISGGFNSPVSGGFNNSILGGNSYWGTGSYGYTPSGYYSNGYVSSGYTTGGISYPSPAPILWQVNGGVTSGNFSGGTSGTIYDAGLSSNCFATVNGNVVTWNATANGGNGFYTYYWTGDESLSGTGSSITKLYTYSGTKNGTVTINSNGQSITRTCSVNVGVQNQVLAFSDNAVPLTGVYLSDVPYTGAGDVLRIFGFILGLIAWSILVAYIFLRKKLAQFIPVLAGIEIAEKKNTVSDALQSANTNDVSDIAKVAEYARSKNVILSTDASVKLVKIQRLGKGKAKDIINTFATGEWTAVGEKDLEKFA